MLQLKKIRFVYQVISSNNPSVSPYFSILHCLVHEVKISNT